MFQLYLKKEFVLPPQRIYVDSTKLNFTRYFFPLVSSSEEEFSKGEIICALHKEISNKIKRRAHQEEFVLQIRQKKISVKFRHIPKYFIYVFHSM